MSTYIMYLKELSQEKQEFIYKTTKNNFINLINLKYYPILPNGIIMVLGFVKNNIQ